MGWCDVMRERDDTSHHITSHPSIHPIYLQYLVVWCCWCRSPRSESTWSRCLCCDSSHTGKRRTPTASSSRSIIIKKQHHHHGVVVEGGREISGDEEYVLAGITISFNIYLSIYLTGMTYRWLASGSPCASRCLQMSFLWLIIIIIIIIINIIIIHYHHHHHHHCSPSCLASRRYPWWCCWHAPASSSAPVKSSRC